VAATKVEKEIGGRVFSIETGKLARQAHGAVVVRLADTIILTAVTAEETRQDLGFFPLTVDYRERGQAAGRIPGGRFYKREGRPSTKEIVTMRLTDRPLRPLFPKSFRQEVLITTQVLSADGHNDPDILSITAASASLMVSPIPFHGPIGAVRVGRVDGELLLFPTVEQLEAGELDLVVASNRSGVTMLEGDAKELPEETLIEAIQFGHQAALQLIALQDDLARGAGISPKVFADEPEQSELEAEILAQYGPAIRESVCAVAKEERREAVKELKKQMVEKRIEGLAKDVAKETAAKVEDAFEKAKKGIIRKMVLDEGARLDGRALAEVRPITCEVGLFPMTHGSALFQRGQTQAVVTTTLGTVRDEESVEGLTGESTRKFMMHYYFPSFSTGEVSMPRGPGRREIGHGALSERSLLAVLPPWDKFPYTIRLVSDIFESNGSSSMASVCGGTLALMDAGVKITRPVAGISIGLVTEGDRWVTLTDIMGEEDFNGDMDFKVAGSQKGVTGIQLDLKIKKISDEIIRKAFTEAREARIQILRQMLECLPAPRKNLSDHAPRLVQMKVEPAKIGAIIGPGGKTIRGIEEQTAAKLDIMDDGTVIITGVSDESVGRARTMVENLTEEVKIGKEYDGKVVSIKDFGCFVEVLPGQEGLVHISELSDTYVEKISDVVKMGDPIRVKVIDIDNQGRVRLSRKAVLTGAGR
jgi:polyribonucleotide nucleotidyltransferase